MAIALRKGNVVLNKTRKFPMKMFMFLDFKTQKQNFLLYSFDFSCLIRVSKVPFGRAITIHRLPLTNLIRQPFLK